MSNATRSTPTLWAQVLGYGGLIPFVGLTAVGWYWPAHQTTAASALQAYSATIVSFLGAIHWGLTMQDIRGQNTGLLVWGVVPSLLAWVGLLLPVTHGLLLMAILLWGCFAMDRVVYTRFGLRAWVPMRLLLSSVASVCCAVSAIRLAGFMA